MNILFVNYGDFTSNSLNHIGAFANALTKKGHSCIVAVPENLDSIRVIKNPLFKASLFSELLTNPNAFPEARVADIIHAWTPREVVRSFVISYQRLAHAKLIIHLEDNEDFLLATWLKAPLTEVKSVTNSVLREKSTLALSHPRRSRAFLQAANAATVITASLKTFLPEELTVLELSPGLDFEIHTPLKADTTLRRTLGIQQNEKVIVLTGSNTFANEAEMRDLYLAVHLLNQGGTPTKLIRTGFTLERFRESLPDSLIQHVIDLGFIEKEKLPSLLALADVLIQPGKTGPFNDYRLPSKLPEFFSSGRPVILPKSNIGLVVKDGVDALLLKEGTPEEIASLCLKLFKDPKLSETLSVNAVLFAHNHFDLRPITEALTLFYKSVLTQTSDSSKTTHLQMNANDISLASLHLAEGSRNTPREDEAKALSDLVTDLVSDLEFSTESLERLKKDAALSADHVKNLEVHLANFKQHTEGLEVQSQAKQKHITNLEIQINELSQRLHLKTVSHDQSLKQIEESNLLLTQFKEFAQQRKNELIAQVAATEAEVESKKRKILAMENSFSWKITAPLRYFRRKVSSK